MSKLELFVIKENVYVPHPYEPVICQHVVCDLCLILDTAITSPDDVFDLTISYLLNEHTMSFYLKRGCLFVHFFHDSHLNDFASLFDYYFGYECDYFPYSQALDLIMSYCPIKD